MDGNRDLAERFIASLEARDWDVWAGLLHPAVIYEIPQSRERIRGRDRYLQFNQEYPGHWHLRAKVVIADEHRGVVWFEWRLGDRTEDAMAFFEFTNGLIARVTDFWPEPYEPPPGREHLVQGFVTGHGLAQVTDTLVRRLDLIPWAGVNCGCDDVGECLILGNRQVVDAADWCPAASVTQDHPLIVREVLHADRLLSLLDADVFEMTPQQEHRDAVQLWRVGPDHRAVAPEPHVSDGAL